MTDHADDQLPVYNMKAVIKETGLNPMTIRSWERRYGLPNPQRTEGRHRLYSQRDIETLKWLLARQTEGLSISHAAKMWNSLEAKGRDPLQNGTYRKQEPESTAFRQPVFVGGEIEILRAAWIDACLRFAREDADLVLTQAFSLFPAETVCLELLQKGIGEIGEGWAQGTATVQQEHFASALAQRRLQTLIASAPNPIHAKKVLLACAPKDNHTFGLLMLSFLLSRNGWDVIYLGANAPVEELTETVAQVKPQLVVMSAQRFYTASTLLDAANELHAYGVSFAFGGYIFNQIPKLRKFVTGHFLGESLDESLERLQSLLSKESVELPPTLSSYRDEQALHNYNKYRTHIESDIWDAFIGRGRSTEFLTELNSEMSHIIIAALKFGDFESLDNGRNLIEHQLISYRLSAENLQDYLYEYYRAAKSYLADSSQGTVGWLAKVIAEESAPTG